MHIVRVVASLMLSAAALPSAAFSSPLTIVNPDFSVPAIACSSGFAYQGPGNCSSTTVGGTPLPQQDFNGTAGFGWTLGTNGDGLTRGGGAFNGLSFSGLPFTQAAFLQGPNSSVSQIIPGFSAGGHYVLSFYLGSRFATGTFDGNQTVAALLNGSVVGTFALTSFTPFTFESVALTGSTTGSETLQFKGLATGDHTAFLSHVSISSPSVPEPSSLELLIPGGALLAFFLRRSRRVARRSE
jgi:hypothetical protein